MTEVSTAAPTAASAESLTPDRTLEADAPEFITVKEAAQRIDVTPWMVATAVKSGYFPEAVRYDGLLLVSATNVERQRISVKAVSA